MADDLAINNMLQRIDRIYRPGRPRSDGEIAAAAVEWQKLLRYCNTARLDEALTEYIRRDTGSYSRGPKPGELLAIYEELTQAQERRMSLNTQGHCPLCGGFKRVLVRAAAEAPFYGHYGELAMVCPCCRPGELAALKRGAKISHKTKLHIMTYWLEYDRLVGQLAKSSPADAK